MGLLEKELATARVHFAQLSVYEGEKVDERVVAKLVGRDRE